MVVVLDKSVTVSNGMFTYLICASSIHMFNTFLIAMAVHTPAFLRHSMSGVWASLSKFKSFLFYSCQSLRR
jgi:hypothetical protein